MTAAFSTFQIPGPTAAFNWQGYSEKRFSSQRTDTFRGRSGARSIEMLPLALYGLDNPKIPALLVDFRDGFIPRSVKCRDALCRT